MTPVDVRAELDAASAFAALVFEAYEAARSIPVGDHWR